MRLGPDASATQGVGLVVCGLALLLSLQAKLPHGLVHGHAVRQQLFADAELQAMPYASRAQELCRLGRDEGHRSHGTKGARLPPLAHWRNAHQRFVDLIVGPVVVAVLVLFADAAVACEEELVQDG